MSWYRGYKLVHGRDGYTVVIYLNPNSTEFSKEFVEDIRGSVLKLDKQIKGLVQRKFSNIRVNTVKLVVGAVVVGTLPFTGYTNAHALTASTASTQQYYYQTYGIVSATKLNMRTGPSTNYAVMHKLYQGNRVKVTASSGSWYKIQLSDGRTGWVSKSYLRLQTQTTRQQKINTIIATAKSLIGTPYVWGGRSLSDGGFDCSGFTQYVFKKAGYTLNRISGDQAAQGIHVARTSLQPGDLVFYSLSGTGRISHVGIYIGGGKMIHSPKTGDTVKMTDITTSYWQSHYITARRIIQ